MEDINPFFVLEAENKIEAGLLDEAISLCNKGLDDFPDYYSGWVLLINCLIKKQNYELAKEKLNYAISIFPNIKVFKTLHIEIQKLIEQFNLNKINNNEELKPENVIINTPKDPINYDETNLNKDEIINSTLDDSNELIISQVKDEPAELNQNLNDITFEETFTKNQDNGQNNYSIHLNSDKIELENIQTNETLNIYEIKQDEAKYNRTYQLVNEELTDKNNINDLPDGFLKKFFNPEKIEIYDNFELSPEIYKIIHNTPEQSQLKRKSFRDINIIDNLSGLELDTELQNISHIDLEHSTEQSNTVIEDEFTILAKKLKNAKIPIPDEKELNIPTCENDMAQRKQPKTIVSETMANIYEEQGAYKEAEKAYKELLENNPDRKQYFLEKLNNLYKKMS